MAKVEQKNFIASVNCDEDHVYVLHNSKDLLVYNARSMQVEKQRNLGVECRAVAPCGNFIWVGDQKGNLIVLDRDLTEVKRIDAAHSQKVTKIISDGKHVFSGDAYRYIKVYDGASHEQVASWGDSGFQIKDLDIVGSRVVSTTTNHAFCVFDMDAQKFVREHKMAHGTRDLDCAAIWDEHIWSAGKDCAIRQWSF